MSLQAGGLVLVLGLAVCQAPRPPHAAGPVNPDPRVATYACDDGERVEVGYPDVATAVVRHRGRPYSLRVAPSASGARYVGFGLQWWSRGRTEGYLAPLAVDETIASAAGVRCVKVKLEG